MGRRLRRAQVEALYEQHGRGLRANACSVTDCFAEAEDAAHLVFERLLHGGIEINGQSAPYLYRAVRNAALNQVLGKMREAELADNWIESPAVCFRQTCEALTQVETNCHMNRLAGRTYDQIMPAA